MSHARVLRVCLAAAFFGCGGDGESSYDDDDGGVPQRSQDGGSDAASTGPAQGGDDAAVQTQALTRVVSVPPTFALSGERYVYRPRTNAETTLAFALSSPPPNMTLVNGLVEWVPAADAVGEHQVSLSAQAGSETVSQRYTLTVAKATELTSGQVTEQGGMVFAADGKAGITVPPGAVPDDVQLTVSELSVAPLLPNSAGTVRALSFGPSGQVFDSPATITLPLPAAGVAPLSAQNLQALVYDPASGRWERVEVLGVDLENGVLTARAQHFSVYAAAQAALSLNLALGAAASDGACPGALRARAELASSIAQVPISAVNGLDPQLSSALGANATLQQLLEQPALQGSLRAVQVFALVEMVGGAEVPLAEQLVATTLHLPGDGSAVVTHADALGNVLASKRFPTLTTEAAAELLARLGGAATSARFASSTDRNPSLTARLHLLYFAGNASTDPLSADELGVAAVEQPPVAVGASAAVADKDCDGVLDDYDATDESTVPRIEADPTALVVLAPNVPATLRASLRNGPPDTITAWQATRSGAPADGVLSETSEATARTFRATEPGRYTVTFRAISEAARYTHQFAVEVIPPPVGNTPPVCRPTRDVALGRVGDPVPLSAVAYDRESPSGALSVEWGLVAEGQPGALVASPTVTARGDRALFAPTAAGEYWVGCRANDGQGWGAVSAVRVPLIAADANRAPTDLSLTPGVQRVGPTQPFSLLASARDPDGDALTFTWTVNGAPVPAGSVEAGDGSSRLRLTAPGQPGTHTIRVAVSDGKPGEPQVALADVVVGERTPPADAGTGSIDGGVRDGGRDAGLDGGVRDGGRDASFDGGPEFDHDDDGVSAEDGDCDDRNPDIGPEERDYCGDFVDNDCDGVVDQGCPDAGVRDGGTGDGGIPWIDGDRDGVPAPFDCNDKNPLVRPNAPESCDGLDNDCDGVVDEGCGVLDGGASDAGIRDGGRPIDAGPGLDASIRDAGARPDGGGPDPIVDAGGTDSGIMDSSVGRRDAGSSDAGTQSFLFEPPLLQSRVR